MPMLSLVTVFQARVLGLKVLGILEDLVVARLENLSFCEVLVEDQLGLAVSIGDSGESLTMVQLSFGGTRGKVSPFSLAAEL